MQKLKSTMKCIFMYDCYLFVIGVIVLFVKWYQQFNLITIWLTKSI